VLAARAIPFGQLLKLYCVQSCYSVQRKIMLKKLLVDARAASARKKAIKRTQTSAWLKEKKGAPKKPAHLFEETK
jgi:hypothetical protein